MTGYNAEDSAHAAGDEIIGPHQLVGKQETQRDAAPDPQQRGERRLHDEAQRDRSPRVADRAQHADLLAPARDDVRLCLERDPGLESPRGQALRRLLRLFERNAAVAYLGSG